MGRPKSVYPDLPPKMTARQGQRRTRYFFTTRQGGKIALGSDKNAAMKKHAILMRDEQVDVSHIDARMASQLDDVAKMLFASCRSNARKRGIEFSLTVSDIDHMLKESDWVCSITNIPFDMSRAEDSSTKKRPFAPSVDRIDSSAGYTVGNCRIVCVAVNLAMNAWGIEVFDKISKAYAHKNAVPNPR